MYIYLRLASQDNATLLNSGGGKKSQNYFIKKKEKPKNKPEEHISCD